jgi:hypothetical protein
MTDHALHRPRPLPSPAAPSVDRTTPPGKAAARLLDGEVLVVTDRYGTGAEILARLQSLVPQPAEDASYEARQGARRAFREASLRLLAPIVDHRLALADAGEIGFLRELYPEIPTFFLPFVQAQELHGAWARYQEGIHLAVLGHRLHPFYGTYAPTRVSHLELFGTWLSQYQGPRTRAVDVGTGCGVLALMLARAGFERVLATDSNPNAVESVARELRRLPPALPIDLLHGDLFGGDTAPADVIVFNPPWLKGEVEEPLDGALHFDDGLFERFFEQATARLTSAGRIALVFSNLIQLVRPDVPHPILTELERGRLRLVSKLHRKVEPSPSRTGRRRRTRERVEVWELARSEPPPSTAPSATGDRASPGEEGVARHDP